VKRSATVRETREGYAQAAPLFEVTTWVRKGVRPVKGAFPYEWLATFPSVTTNDDAWEHDSDAWGVDRLVWEEEDGGPPIDLDESPETPEGRRS
jgi:hypothetical protein